MLRWIREVRVTILTGEYYIQSNIEHRHDMRLNDTVQEDRSILGPVIFYVAMLLPLIGDSQEDGFYQNN